LLTLLALSINLLGNPEAFGCEAQHQYAVAVNARHGEILVKESFSLAKIEELAKNLKRSAKHPTLGFYFSGIGYKATVESSSIDTGDARAVCAPSTRIHVSILADDRTIELAQELRNTPCLLSLYEAHYRKHAMFDDALIEQLANDVYASLNKDLGSFGSAEKTVSPNEEMLVRQKLQQIISPIIFEANKSRRSMATQADTPAEIEHLKHACDKRL